MKIISEFISENCSTSQLIAVFFILGGNERQEFAVVHPYLIKSGSFWQKSKTFKLIILFAIVALRVGAGTGLDIALRARCHFLGKMC